MRALFLCLLTFWATFFLSCREDLEVKNQNLHFAIAQDSLFLDTIYSGVSSPVFSFQIKNQTKKNLLIPEIYLENTSSYIHLNIHGKSGQNFDNVPLLKGDSLRILFQIVAPESTESKEIKEKIIFKGLENNQKNIEISGFIQKSKIYKNTDDLIFQNNQATLHNDIAHIFTKDLVVAQHQTLNIQPKTKLLFFHESKVILNPNSELNSNGTPEKRVIFKGFRNDAGYDSIPLQWKGIKAQNAKINLHSTEIKAAEIGLDADESDLVIDKSLIINSGTYGIRAKQSKLKIFNSVFFNASQATLLLEGPLETEIIYSSFANPGIHQYAQSFGENIPMEIKDYQNQPFQVINSIFHGRYRQGVVFGSKPSKPMIFSHVLIKNDDEKNLDLNDNHIFNAIITRAPLFKSIFLKALDLSLQKNSPAKQKGISIESISTDLNDQSRRNPPDLGAYTSIAD